MAKKSIPQITLSDVNRKRLKILGYLLLSGVFGELLAYIAGKPELVAVFAPAINFILFSLKEELDGEGYIKALKK